VNQADQLAELEAMLAAMLAAMGKRIAAMRAEQEGKPKPVVDRQPPPEAYAKLAALKRRQGRRPHGT
jgi:hypothetical protein